MRIVYMLTSLGVGGAERLTLALAECMRERGHAVAVFTLRPRLEEELLTTVPIFRLGMYRNPQSSLAALIRARRYLRDLRPDIIHSHSFHANIFARLLKLLLLQPKMICTIHNVNEGGSLRMLAYRLTDPLSRQTTAVSQTVAERFIAMRAVPAAKCAVVLNAIDLAAFTPDIGRRAETRSAMGANSDFIWLAAGRLASAKDYPNLLCAFAKLRALHPGAQLWIAGQGTCAQLTALKTLAAGLGIEERIRWLGLRRDLARLLDAADAFVLSSAWEGMPLVAAEAMAAEKPVVATDVGGVRELLGETGLTVAPQNPDQLCQAMHRLMLEPVEARSARGRAARERIRQCFSMETRANEWESFYCRVLSSPMKTAVHPS